MGPLGLFFLAILTPFMLLAALLLPGYAAIWAASYIIYYPASGAHPLAGRWGDVSSIVDLYMRLIADWSQHMGAVSFVHYTLPLIGLPLVALIISLLLLRWLVRVLRDAFHMATGSH